MSGISIWKVRNFPSGILNLTDIVFFRSRSSELSSNLTSLTAIGRLSLPVKDSTTLIISLCRYFLLYSWSIEERCDSSTLSSMYFSLTSNLSASITSLSSSRSEIDPTTWVSFSYSGARLSIFWAATFLVSTYLMALVVTSGSDSTSAIISAKVFLRFSGLFKYLSTLSSIVNIKSLSFVVAASKSVKLSAWIFLATFVRRAVLIASFLFSILSSGESVESSVPSSTSSPATRSSCSAPFALNALSLRILSKIAPLVFSRSGSLRSMTTMAFALGL